MQYGPRARPSTTVERQLDIPAANIAAATLSLALVVIRAPSTRMVTSGTGRSVNRRTIEPPGAEHRQFRRYARGRDQGRKRLGVARCERHAAMAVGDEGAAVLARLVIDGAAILGHHALRRPCPDDVDVPQA